ncbi:uncharacterized protein LOC126741130 [Anthonomus grandis grandis]|uniref:uncharacterized protein LOC126741130 n=1 Tax=Anthonomus grandis grandis TaxID=2921223 RepID=UPI002166356A|nr:uncharacterized protein LOC126741130 [Anthonomus grandis grandis]
MAATSITLPVEFVDTLDHYCNKSNLTCKLKINDSYTSQGKDYVAIYKLGWTHVTDYVTIKNVTDIIKDRTCEVVFNKHILPNNTQDLFHMCFLNGQELLGASTPFQFCEEESVVDSAMSFINTSNSRSVLIIEKDLEIQRLKEENNILKESLRSLLNKSEENGYDKELKEIKVLVEGLKLMLSDHDKDIAMLKDKIREGGELYKQLYFEKCKVQKKYEKLKNIYVIQESQSSNEALVDNLQSLPPFPSITNNLLQ